MLSCLFSPLSHEIQNEMSDWNLALTMSVCLIIRMEVWSFMSWRRAVGLGRAKRKEGKVERRPEGQAGRNEWNEASKSEWLPPFSFEWILMSSISIRMARLLDQGNCQDGKWLRICFQQSPPSAWQLKHRSYCASSIDFSLSLSLSFPYSFSRWPSLRLQALLVDRGSTNQTLLSSIPLVQRH